ncbi:MAG: hypothetical protein WKF83_03745 [Nocardioidaceae bacterium]
MPPETTHTTEQSGAVEPQGAQRGDGKGASGLGDDAVGVEEVQHLFAEHACVDLHELDAVGAYRGEGVLPDRVVPQRRRRSRPARRARRVLRHRPPPPCWPPRRAPPR